VAITSAWRSLARLRAAAASSLDIRHDSKQPIPCRVSSEFITDTLQVGPCGWKLRCNSVDALAVSGSSLRRFRVVLVRIPRSSEEIHTLCSFGQLSCIEFRSHATHCNTPNNLVTESTDSRSQLSPPRDGPLSCASGRHVLVRCGPYGTELAGPNE